MPLIILIKKYCFFKTSSSGQDRSPGNPFSENDDANDTPGNPFDSGEEECDGTAKTTDAVMATPTPLHRDSIQPSEDLTPPPPTSKSVEDKSDDDKDSKPASNTPSLHVISEIVFMYLFITIY